jgi:hypothetical protein
MSASDLVLVGVDEVPVPDDLVAADEEPVDSMGE